MTLHAPFDVRSAPWFHASLDGDGPTLAGELDLSRLDALRAVLDQALLEPGNVVRVDASRLSFIDSRAISELLLYEVMASASQRNLWLDPVSPRVAEVLEMLDLCEILMPPTDASVPKRQSEA